MDGEDFPARLLLIREDKSNLFPSALISDRWMANFNSGNLKQSGKERFLRREKNISCSIQLF
jgi:hypothetical protein